MKLKVYLEKLHSNSCCSNLAGVELEGDSWTAVVVAVFLWVQRVRLLDVFLENKLLQGTNHQKV
jgi:hypothetical protein